MRLLDTTCSIPEWARNAGLLRSPASPTSADTTATSSGWPQAMLIEVSRRHMMRKPTDDRVEPTHLVFAKQTPAYLACSWHEAQIGLETAGKTAPSGAYLVQALV